MADYNIPVRGTEFIEEKYVDQGDGTHAKKISITTTSTTVTATIPAGGSLSGEVDLNGHQIVAIYMPGTWQAANITFTASNVSGGTFYDVYDSAGNELTVTASASRTIVDIPELAPLRFIKVRSGTSGTPVTQGANRNIILIVK